MRLTIMDAVAPTAFVLQTAHFDKPKTRFRPNQSSQDRTDEAELSNSNISCELRVDWIRRENSKSEQTVQAKFTSEIVCVRVNLWAAFAWKNAQVLMLVLVLSSLVTLQKLMGGDAQTIPFTFPLFLSFKFSLCFNHLRVANMTRHLRLPVTRPPPPQPSRAADIFQFRLY